MVPLSHFHNLLAILSFFLLFLQNDGMLVFIWCHLTIKRTMMRHSISTPEFFYPWRMESEAWALGSRMITNAQVTSSQTDATHAYVMNAQSRNLWNLFFFIGLAENHDIRNLKCLTDPSTLTPWAIAPSKPRKRKISDSLFLFQCYCLFALFRVTFILQSL